MKIKLISSDVMTRTRLLSRWKAAGATVLSQSSAEAPDLIIIDIGESGSLDNVRFERAKYPTARIIAFGPHVETDSLYETKKAGAHEVVARGKVADRVLKRIRESQSAEDG